MKCLISVSLVFLCATACVNVEPLPQTPYEADVELSSNVIDWRDEVIYQIIVDRFEDGDVNTNFNVDRRSPAAYHGGDWQGIIDRLDYLQGLGVTTLWISPVVRNVETDAGFDSYHGYWTQHFTEHNPHFGDLHDLRRLSDALHARNMKLILDVVTNHVGQVFFYDINGNSQPDEYLSGSTADPGADPFSKLERVTEYDPDYDPRGIQGKTGLGESGPATVIFFHDPEIYRIAPGPQNMDLNKDGRIEGADEVLGFANPGWYHRRGRVTDWDSNPPSLDGIDYIQGEQTLFGDFPGGLKDVATSNPATRQALIDVFTYWIDATDADGFRIDTLKHVEIPFWEAWAPAMRQHAASRGKRNFFMFGEVFDGRDNLLGAYTGPNQVDSVFYFSQKFRVFDNIFKCAPGNQSPFCWDGSSFRAGGTSGVQALLDDRRAFYHDQPQPGGAVDATGQGLSPQQLLVNFIDNHDVPRYLFERPDERGIASLHNALFYLLTEDGIPCIYYGTEQAFFGGNDPRNREDMDDRWASRYSNQAAYQIWSTNNPTYLHIQKLTRLRQAYPALRRGDLSLTWTSDRTGSERDAGILAFERSYEGQTALVVINTHELQTSETRAPDDLGGDALMTSFSGGTVLVDVFSDSRETFTVAGDGSITVPVPLLAGRVLVPQDQVIP